DGVQRLAREIRAISGTPEPETASGGPHPQHRRAPDTAAAQPPPTTRKIASLSIDGVCTLLRNLDLGKYEAGFRAVPIRGVMLATMNDEGLREVGVDMGVHRTALLHHVTEFRAGGVPLELLVKAGGVQPEAGGGQPEVPVKAGGGGPEETAAAEPPPTARKLTSLSIDEVCTLLWNLGTQLSNALGKYEAGFQAVPVSGAVLATMNDEGLREVGVDMGVHRTALLHHVAEFRAGGVPLELLASVEGLVAERVKESKDIGLIISIMGVRTSSAGVQEAGCYALCNLAANAANQVAIAAQGGIAAVLKAMGAHASIAGVQEYGCRALVNLALNAENKVAIAARGGIAAVLRAMGAHASIAGVQQWGCWALHSIARTDAGLRSQIRDAGAVPLVQKALAAFPGEAKLQEHGKGLLEKLGA
ncbi:armadillo-type protein, partial [Baffinella frigidus]